MLDAVDAGSSDRRQGSRANSPGVAVRSAVRSCRIRLEDCRFGKDGLDITSEVKTDQPGTGPRLDSIRVQSDTCPVRVVQTWMEPGIGSGPLLRSINRHGQVQPQVVWYRRSRIVKKLVKRELIPQVRRTFHCGQGTQQRGECRSFGGPS